MSKSEKKKEKRRARRQAKKNQMLTACFVAPIKEEHPCIQEKAPEQSNEHIKEHRKPQKDIEKILESLNLPTLAHPGKENGVIYYAEACNITGEFPFIVIKAFKNGKKDETFIKAAVRGVASFFPTLGTEGCEVAIKRNPNSGAYTRIKGFFTPEEAVRVLLSELRSL
ncbi:MAG: hypothetical protein Q8O83_05260 [bacterium]|nr:hypothetical protein [bacterium]